MLNHIERIVTHWAIWTSIVGGIIGTALYFSIPAEATPDAASQLAYTQGNIVCDTVNRYPTPAIFATIHAAILAETDLTPPDSAKAIVLSLAIHCPYRLPLLQQYIHPHPAGAVM